MIEYTLQTVANQFLIAIQVQKELAENANLTRKNTTADLLSLLVYHQPLLTKTTQPVFLCLSHFSHL